MSALLGLGALGVASNLFATGLNQGNYNEQLDFAKYQYEDMKRRQDPVNQVRRLRAAGINPALAYGNVQLGQATGSSVPSANPAQPLSMEGLASVGNGLDLNATTQQNIQSQTEKNQVQTEGERTDNLFRAENWKSLIYGRDAQSWLNNKLADAAKLDVDYQTNTLKFRVEQQRQQMALLQSQVAAQDLANHYFPFEASEKIATLVSEQFANYATGKSSLSMAHQNLMRLFAEVGKDPKERHEFFNASLNLLRQQKEESRSRERANDRVVGQFGAGFGFVNYPQMTYYDKKKGRYVDY